MSRVRAVLSLLILVGLVLAQPAAMQAARRPTAGNHKKKKHLHHTISGTVVKVHHNKTKKGAGTIQVRVHHKKRKNKNAQAGAVQKNAAAAGQKKKKHHTVKVHFNKSTHFAVVSKGLVQGKAQKRSFGSGKNKKTIVMPGKVSMKTQQTPTHAGSIHKGQHIVVRIPQGKQHASHIHILHASAQKKIAANKP